jgi:hypothetical protein
MQGGRSPLVVSIIDWLLLPVTHWKHGESKKANARRSELVNKAEKEGAQVITRCGF